MTHTYDPSKTAVMVGGHKLVGLKPRPEATGPTPSRALCARVLRDVLGPTARFQAMRGAACDGAIGWRVLVEGRELVRVTPKDDRLVDYNPFDREMPLLLLRAACNVVGLDVECPNNGTIKVHRRAAAQAPAPTAAQPAQIADSTPAEGPAEG